MKKNYFIHLTFFAQFITLNIWAQNSAVPSLKKVMIVIFENTNYKDAVKQPFMGQLAKEGALFTNYKTITHPSQGNYIALVSGSQHGVNGDGNHDINARNLADLLEEKNIKWKVYAEKYPGRCFTGKSSGTYVRKHNPLISFLNVQKNTERCAKIVNATDLDLDIKQGRLPDFSLYIPDMNNDGHDTGVEYADKWYKSKFAPLLKNDAFMRNMLLITTFDESKSSLSSKVYTSFYGYNIKVGSKSDSKYNHYNLLRTLELGFGLNNFGLNDIKAKAITDIWKP